MREKIDDVVGEMGRDRMAGHGLACDHTSTRIYEYYLLVIYCAVS